MEPIRLILCIGQHCNATGVADQLYQRLEETLGAPSDFRCTQTVQWRRANCLNKCKYGPNLVLHPKRRWFYHTDLDKLEPIIEHFLQLRAANND